MYPVEDVTACGHGVRQLSDLFVSGGGRGASYLHFSRLYIISILIQGWLSAHEQMKHEHMTLCPKSVPPSPLVPP